jgi:exodeoxyribonuclease V alpha subunit
MVVRHGEQTGEHGGGGGVLTTSAGEEIGVGDRVATRRNDRDLGVANRDTWTVTAVGGDGSVAVRGRAGDRHLPAAYVHHHLELAFATTVYGAQGETVDHAHLLIGETTGAAAAYVAMTRGRHGNTAHLVAESVQDARAQWVEVFARDRADLGPAHAAHLAADDVDRYGPRARRSRGPNGVAALQGAALDQPGPRRSREPIPGPRPGPDWGIGIGF